MRLIAWNANFNNRKCRSLDDNVRLLAVFYPDVIVLSETALPPHSPHLSDRLIAIGEPPDESGDDPQPWGIANLSDSLQASHFQNATRTPLWLQ